MWKIIRIILKWGNSVLYARLDIVSCVELYNTDTFEKKSIIKLDNDKSSWLDILKSHCDNEIPKGYFDNSGDSFFFIYSNFGSKLYDLLEFSHIARCRVDSDLAYMRNVWNYIVFKTEKGYLTLEEIILHHFNSCRVMGVFLSIGTKHGDAIVYKILDVNKFNLLITKGMVLGNALRK